MGATKVEIRNALVLDFETDAIKPRPEYPPKPCGVALWLPKSKPRYYHGDEELREAREVFRDFVLHSAGLIICHNARFDLDVAETFWGCKAPWVRVLDTQILLFLADPHAKSFGLKPSAERLLGEPPDEQNLLHQWLIAKQPVDGVRITKKSAGAYVSYAPRELIEPYAIGDVLRTRKLALRLSGDFTTRQMRAALAREQALLPVLLEMERAGVRVDTRRLRADVAGYGEVAEQLDAWILQRLEAPAELNLNSGEQLAAALVACGAVKDLPKTPTGKLKSDKATLDEAIDDPQLKAALRYRGALKTYIGTFLSPWLETTKRTGDRIYTAWHSTRHTGADRNLGARTGRLSSTPNFQNLPKKPKRLFDAEGLPESPILLPDLPKVRDYILPERGHVFIRRDYSQQELRLLAEFSGDALSIAYQDDPWIDAHEFTRQRVLEVTGRNYDRDTAIKPVNFGLIYGMGVKALAKRIGCDEPEAKRLKAAVLAAYPGIRDLYASMKQRAANNTPLYTWGGRRYLCEPPKVVDGKVRSFDYKMVNVLIQGSAADVTKQAVLNFAAAADVAWQIKMLVHDEIVVSVPVCDCERAMIALEVAMLAVDTKIKMLSEGSVGESFGSLVDYDRKGVKCQRTNQKA